MRISDWSADVCSSDLAAPSAPRFRICCCCVGASRTFVKRFWRRIPVPTRRRQRDCLSTGCCISRATRCARRRPKALERVLTIRGRLTSRSEEHTSELQSLMRISYAVFCLKKKKSKSQQTKHYHPPTD